MTHDERDEAQQERPRIKVTDRRLFDREGNPRPEAEDARPAAPERPPETVGEPPSEAPPGQADTAAEPRPRDEHEAPAPEPARPAADPAAAGVVADSPAADADEGPSPLAGGPGDASELPRDFAAFIESQYYETLLYLGAMRHPATGQVMEDLDMAQYKIDVLSMLQEKTEGNRSPEETKLLDDVLYQLRMAYLQKRKVAKL